MTARTALLITTTLASAAAAGMVWFVAHGDAPHLTLSLLGIIALLYGVCGGAIVWFTRVPMDRIEAIAEGLRLISSGRRDGRLEAATFGELSIIASAHNTLAAALSERDDPNLGPVRVSGKRPYQKSAEDADVGLARRISASPQDPSELEAEARENKKRADEEAKAAKDKERDAKESAERDAKAAEREKKERQAKELKAKEDADREAREKEAAKGSSDNATLIGHASAPPVESKPQRPKRRRKKKRKARAETTQEWEQRSQPTLVESVVLSDDDVRALFADFATALGDDDAPEYREFDEAIREQHQALLEAHQCKGVRFEVTTVEGEVSLLPRLIR